MKILKHIFQTKRPYETIDYTNIITIYKLSIFWGKN